MIMAGKWWLPRWWLYRPVMRLAHRFNWHWMPPCYPDGDTLLRCSWCGASYVIPRPSPLVIGCQRSHPHESMNPECAAKTEVVRAAVRRESK